MNGSRWKNYAGFGESEDEGAGDGGDEPKSNLHHGGPEDEEPAKESEGPKKPKQAKVPKVPKNPKASKIPVSFEGCSYQPGKLAEARWAFVRKVRTEDPSVSLKEANRLWGLSAERADFIIGLPLDEMVRRRFIPPMGTRGKRKEAQD